MMLEECGSYLDMTIDKARDKALLTNDDAAEASIAVTFEAYARLKLHVREGKVPVTWTRSGEEASFVASLALKQLREHCRFIVDNYAVFSASARTFALTFALTFARVDDAIRERRCERDVLLRKAQ